MYWRRVRQAAVLAVALAAIFAGQARALTLVPPKPGVLFGVSDQGTTQEFNEFAELLAKHPALLETFHPWGNSLNQAYERWRETGDAAGPAHLDDRRPDPGRADHARSRSRSAPATTTCCSSTTSSPNAGCPPTSGRWASPTAASTPGRRSTATARQKGGEHTTGWYKQAFRRIVAIVRGGQTLEGINATLAEIGLPPLNRTKGPNPTELPAAPVSIIWSPLPGGSPRVKGNFPGNYWPGARWVDWVGTDFYSEYPVWKDLNRFYVGKQWKGKPIAITEWAVSGKDEPRFVKQLIAWTVKHPRVRMFVYYTGFGPGAKPLRPAPLPAHDQHPAPQAPPRNLPPVRRIQRRHSCRRCPRHRRKPPSPSSHADRADGTQSDL